MNVENGIVSPTLRAEMGGHPPLVLLDNYYNSSGDDVAWTLDGHYHLGAGNRGGRERVRGDKKCR